LVLGQGTQAYVDEACADQPWHREHVRAFEYVPYAHVFPRAAAIVHHGGIGSIAAALRAGKPMLLVPLGFDQLHNAWRAAHLGFARVVAGHCYTLPRAMRELALLLRDTRTRQAAACGSIVLRQEAGTPAACDAIEEFLARPRPPRAGSKSKGDAHLRHASRRLAPSRVHDRRRLSD
jgi:UDP:flavonoid glycosyltransferase YjiC (YdhE family)